MMLDLHIEGAAPVTLLVRDESRSTRSTSVNRDEDVDLDEVTANANNSSGPCSPQQPQRSNVLSRYDYRGVTR